MTKEFLQYLLDEDWTVVHTEELPPRDAAYVVPNTTQFHATTASYLRQFEKGIYVHQHEGIQLFKEGRDLCLATTTASGKSLVFYVCGLELLAHRPNAKVLAVYPLKALGTEQEGRWREALNDAGIDARIGRIDGSVPVSNRNQILRDCQVLIMTPDVVHAWMLSNVANRSIQAFLRQLGLVIVDEAHTYTGVFGSNSAFLYRRLNHLASLLGNEPRYIAASATIRSPEAHLKKLLGRDVAVVGVDKDTSARNRTTILMLDPPESVDAFTSLTGLMGRIAQENRHQFITFVDSRKQTEQLAAVMARDSEDDDEEIDFEVLKDLRIFPYRSGYEELDRRRIQDRLARGELQGVISTSALEMGIDIPHLTMAILHGVPSSATSFFQRIGRVGRKGDGVVLIVNNGNVRTSNVFRHPEKLLKMPLAESALYLDNSRIQYIHALCLARPGGEDESVRPLDEDNLTSFESAVGFPEAFLELCHAERLGEIAPEYQAIKAQAGEEPNYAFPLRDCEVSYQVVFQQGGSRTNLGSLSHSQVMREAYPGAVYYYQTVPYRVTKVNVRSKTIDVRRDRHYTTSPLFIPTLIFPNLADGNVYQAAAYGDLRIVESNLQIRECIIGFNERRGPNKFFVPYPLDASLGLFFDLQRFTRNYFTSGITLSHPALNGENVNRGKIAEVLYEAFLISVPFERQDVSFSDDKHRADREAFGLKSGDRFIAIYDQAYGSLRLTSRVCDENVLKALMETAVDIAENDESFGIDDPTRRALAEIASEISEHRVSIGTTVQDELPEDDKERIIMPGSKGLNVNRDNEEFYVEDIFFNPRRGLLYKGKHLSQQNQRFTNAVVTVGVNSICEIPGESQMGYYNYETGEVESA